MTDQTEAARNGEALPEALARIGPPGLGAFLEAGAGFRIVLAGGGAAPEPAPDGPGRYRLGGTGLVAEVTVTVAAELGVAVQSVTLTNERSAASPEIDLLDAFRLPLTVRLKDCPRACGFGGGTTDGFYPPRAYREEEVCFGQARPWEPARSSFTRWWTGKRWYTLTSGPDGRSSNPNLPLMQVGWDGPEGRLGLWAALEWSGRWELQMGTDEGWRFVFRGGPTVRKMVLAAGERIELPRAHVGAWGGPGSACEDGFNRVRRYVAEALAPDVEGRRPHPFVAYHHWFGIETDLSDSLLRKQADRAAELGVEYFEVDAGWYGGASENFANGVGNWERVDKQKFPDGLEPFAEYVRSKGLRFGLWFEPERGRAGSDWVTQHPEWYWQADSKVNFHLDLTQRRVQDALIEMLSGWVRRLDIRWLRWDNNQAPGAFWDKVDPTGKVQFAYLAGLCRVWDALLGRHPNLMIDNCAGGGQRVDFGTLRRAGAMVISDHAEDPHICRVMQTGGARVLPGNYMNSSIYLGPDDGDRTVGPLELISRMAGSISLSGHIANWSARHARRVRKYLDGYRSFRHLLMKDFHRLSAYPRSPGDWDVVQFVDPGSAEAVLLAYRVRGEQRICTVRPSGLDPVKTYEIVDPFSPGKTRKLPGIALMEKGLRLSLRPESGLARHLVPVE